jgi:hypothetical protein
MSLGGALFAMSAVQAVSQIGHGYAQKAENDYNATLLEGKANLIDTQKEIESGRYDRLKGQYLSKSIANVAASGIMPQGSALAVMLDAQTQINIDQAISKFNFDTEKSYTMSESEAQRRAGKSAVRGGYTNAFSSMLSGAANYAMYKHKATSFDSNTSIPKTASGG